MNDRNGEDTPELSRFEQRMLTGLLREAEQRSTNDGAGVTPIVPFAPQRRHARGPASGLTVAAAVAVVLLGIGWLAVAPPPTQESAGPPEPADGYRYHRAIYELRFTVEGPTDKPVDVTVEQIKELWLGFGSREGTARIRFSGELPPRCVPALADAVCADLVLQSYRPITSGPRVPTDQLLSGLEADIRRGVPAELSPVLDLLPGRIAARYDVRVGTLPASPDALRAVAERLSRQEAEAGQAFVFGLLTTPDTSPAQRAAAFDLARTMPGITVTGKDIPDRLGRPGVRLTTMVQARPVTILLDRKTMAPLSKQTGIPGGKTRPSRFGHSEVVTFAASGTVRSTDEVPRG